MLSFEDVQREAWNLRVQGRTPSGNALLHLFKSKGQPVSKRTILKYLRAGAAEPPARPDEAYPVPTRPPVPAVRVILPGAGDDLAPGAAPLPVREPPPAPVAITEPPPAAPALNGHAAPPDDPVATAAQAVLGATYDLDIARQNMQDACLHLFLAGGVVVDGVRYGALEPEDPARQLLIDQAKETTAAYRIAWRRLLQARAGVKAAHETARRQRQQAWTARERPEVCADLARAEQARASATTDRERYVARLAYQDALFRYQGVLLSAPVD
jgi:hypothetical protein